MCDVLFRDQAARLSDDEGTLFRIPAGSPQIDPAICFVIFDDIDLEGYGVDLLEEAGYVLTSDESAYIARNNREFLYEWSNPEEVGMTLQ